jgi:hypothetical protein
MAMIPYPLCYEYLGFNLPQYRRGPRPDWHDARFALYHGSLRLLPHQSLKEQGIVGKAATPTCTFDQTDLYAAWCFLTGREKSQEFALEGVTKIKDV